MSIPLLGKRIAVTGGAGFLGSFVVEKLRTAGADEPFVPRSREYDLTVREGAAQLYADIKPELLFHLAARVGGIGANRRNPGRFFFENMAMGMHIIEEARRYGRLRKLIVVGTTCSYPKFTTPPFREEDLWRGYPEETNAPYGIAKKALLVMAQAYRQQYGLNSIFLVPANLYGPNDNFDLEDCHVIPAMIRKFLEAVRGRKAQVTLWGSGQPTREFLFVEDAAEAIVLAAERYEKAEPANIGSGQEISIKELAGLIARLTNFRGEIVWDRSQPDGQPRRSLDVSRAWEEFGFRAKIGIEEGIQRTIDSYQSAAIRPATTCR